LLAKLHNTACINKQYILQKACSSICKRWKWLKPENDFAEQNPRTTQRQHVRPMLFKTVGEDLEMEEKAECDARGIIWHQ